MTAERYIASVCLSLLVTAATFGSKRRPQKYSVEDVDYDNDFENYSYVDEYADLTPLNSHGTLRRSFAIDAALLDPRQNFVCSPLAALFPLGILALGANGPCLDQLLSAIGIDSPSQLKKEFKPLIKRLTKRLKASDRRSTLYVFSKIFVPHNFELASVFRHRVEKIFDTAVETAKFTDRTTTAEVINEWVRNHTRQKIPTMIEEDELWDDNLIVLVNAVYYSNRWQQSFTRVRDARFYGNLRTQMIPMIATSGYYNYTISDELEAEIIEIPFVQDRESFVVVLPHSATGLPVLLHKLKQAPELLMNAVSELKFTELILSMPKFKTDAEFDSKETYYEIGVGDIFKIHYTGLRNMSKTKGDIYNNYIFVTKAKQKTIIEISEAGAKIGKTSVFDLMTALNSTIYKTKVIADHPFMYFVTFQRELLLAGIFNFDDNDDAEKAD